METGVIDLEAIPGGLALGHTLESGQSYLWRPVDGRRYGTDPGSGWYETAFDDGWIQIRQEGNRLEWRSNDDPTQRLRELLRLDDDLLAIYDQLPADPLIDGAIDRYRGMRLVRDPPFPCLISFICSAQMRVERIHAMQQALARTYGRSFTVDGREIHAYPTPDELAAATET